MKAFVTLQIAVIILVACSIIGRYVFAAETANSAIDSSNSNINNTEVIGDKTVNNAKIPSNNQSDATINNQKSNQNTQTTDKASNNEQAVESQPLDNATSNMTNGKTTENVNTDDNKAGASLNNVELDGKVGATLEQTDKEAFAELQDTDKINKQLEEILSTIKDSDPTKPEIQSMVDASKGKEDKEEPKLEPIELTAIFITPNNKLAVINGKIAREGDVVADRRIIKIYANKIVVNELGKDVEKLLPNPPIRMELK